MDYMNGVNDILRYSMIHNIQLYAKDDWLVLNAPEDSLTNDFKEAVKQHKKAILIALCERWNPELDAKGYVWCINCTYWNKQACTHPDNPFRKQCAHAPRKCRWFKS